MRNVTSRLAIATTLGLALQTGAVAYADTAFPVTSKAVSLTDLDLTQSTDRVVLRSRLKTAANEVCQTAVPMADATADARCKQDTYSAAMKKVNEYLSTFGIKAAVKPVAGSPSKLVSLSDLDLAKSDHLEIVRNRLKAAAREVCTTTGQIDLWADAQCEKDTYTTALKKFNEQLISVGLAAGIQPVARVDSN